MRSVETFNLSDPSVTAAPCHLPLRKGGFCSETLGFLLGGHTMQPKQNKQLVPFARQLRKNMTKEERHLWYDYLRTHPARFTRQKILGKYIADFYSATAKLVVELDGSQHYEDENQRKDAVRTSFLEEYGLMVLRIPNNAVNRNFRGVCEYIDYTIEQRMTEE